jgi:hypothetical protein
MLTMPVTLINSMISSKMEKPPPRRRPIRRFFMIDGNAVREVEEA